MEGKRALGASSPANPALHIPEPLSTKGQIISENTRVLSDINPPLPEQQYLHHIPILY